MPHNYINPLSFFILLLGLLAQGIFARRVTSLQSTLHISTRTHSVGLTQATPTVRPGQVLPVPVNPNTDSGHPGSSRQRRPPVPLFNAPPPAIQQSSNQQQQQSGAQNVQPPTMQQLHNLPPQQPSTSNPNIRKLGLVQCYVQTAEKTNHKLHETRLYVTPDLIDWLQSFERTIMKECGSSTELHDAVVEVDYKGEGHFQRMIWLSARTPPTFKRPDGTVTIARECEESFMNKGVWNPPIECKNVFDWPKMRDDKLTH